MAKRFTLTDTETGEITEVLEEKKEKHPYKQDWYMGRRTAQKLIAKDPDFTLEAYRVLNLLIGEIGWGNWIEITQKEIADELDMRQPNVSRTIKFLVSKGVLEKTTSGRCNKLRLNPDYWMRGNPTRLHRVK